MVSFPSRLNWMHDGHHVEAVGSDGLYENTDGGIAEHATCYNNSDRKVQFRQECKKSCPVVRMGKLCIEVTPSDK